MGRVHLPVVLFSLFLAACGPEFDPPSQVNKLRLLALKAEPPEIAGGAGAGALPDRTTLSTLVADPAQVADPAREATVLHLSCTPDPRDAEGLDCTAIGTLRDPAALAALLAAGSGAAPGVGVVGGVSLAGVESCDGRGACVPAAVNGVPLPAPSYAVPADLDLASLPPGHPARAAGVQVTILSVLVAASPDELFGGDPAGVGGRLAALLEERENVVAVKRIVVRGPDAVDPPNVNPTVPGILAAGAPLPADPAAAPTFAPKAEVRLLPRPPAIPLDEHGEPDDEAVYQVHTRLDRNGRPSGTMTEEWLYSWFATAGSLSHDRTRADDPCTWTAPDGSKDEPLPEGGRALVFLVVRDARGGIDWAVRELGVDPAAR
jgi:hypothetical protein